MVSPKTARTPGSVSNAIFAIVSILSAAALLPFLNKSISRDEGGSLYSAHLGWTALWHQSLVVDRVVLVYYALLHFWLELSYSIQWARAPSLLAYGLTVYFVGVLANRVAGFWCGLLAVVITCTSPLMITEALNTRPYALATLTSVLSVAALMRWFDRGELRWVWLFSFLAIAALMLQLFSVLAPLSVLGASAVMKPQMFGRQWRRLLAPIGTLVVAVVTFLAIVAHQQGQVAWIGDLNPKSFLEDIEGPASSALGHLIYPVVIAVIGLLTVAGCIVGWRRRNLRPSRFEVDRLVVCLCWAVVPAAILILITAVKPIYVDRYVTASVPGMAIALALLITYALRALPAWSTVRWQIIVNGAMIAILVILIANSVAVSRSQFENLESAAQYIMGNASPTSEVALPDHSITTAVEYYLERAGSPLRRWPQVSDQSFIEGLDLRESASAFVVAPSNVWLVNDGSVKGTRAYISSLRSHGYFRVKSRSINGVGVIHFRRR